MTLINVISPHIDDSVFSLGSYMEQLRQSHELAVINVFSICTFAFGKLLPATAANMTRKSEDHVALSHIGVRSVRYLDLPEALLRGYRLEDLSQFSGALATDDDVITEATARLRDLVVPGSVVFAPAGFGSHVDHLHVRLACQGLDAILVYYADLPYAADRNRFDHAGAVEFTRTMQRQVISVSHNLVEQHISLCKYYESQFEPSFADSMAGFLHLNHYILWSHNEFATLDLNI